MLPAALRLMEEEAEEEERHLLHAQGEVVVAAVQLLLLLQDDLEVVVAEAGLRSLRLVLEVAVVGWALQRLMLASRAGEEVVVGRMLLLAQVVLVEEQEPQELEALPRYSSA